MGAPLRFSPAMGNAPWDPTQGDEVAGVVDPPRSFLSICALKRLVGETGSPLSFTPAREHARLRRAGDSPKLRLSHPSRPQSGTARTERAPPCQLHCEGTLQGRNKSGRGAGGEKVHGPGSSTGLGAAEPPQELVCKRKSPGEDGELGTAPPVCPRRAAPRIPLLFGFLDPRVSSLVGLVQVPASNLSLPGKVRGFRRAGVSQSGRAGPGRARCP